MPHLHKSHLFFFSFFHYFTNKKGRLISFLTKISAQMDTLFPILCYHLSVSTYWTIGNIINVSMTCFTSYATLVIDPFILIFSSKPCARSYMNHFLLGYHNPFDWYIRIDEVGYYSADMLLKALKQPVSGHTKMYLKVQL